MVSNRKEITKEARFFLAPEKPLHRQYEALRTYFVEKKPSKEVAQAFGYSPGAFRVLCFQFRRNPNLQERFFKEVSHGPHAAPKRDQVRELVVSLRKRSLSVYDIQRELVERGYEISVNALSILLREEGFVRLPRRRDEQRPQILKPDAAPVADVRKLDLSPRSFRTAVAGLFLFLPLLIDAQMERAVQAAGLPGTKMIPAEHALRSLLALKLLGKERQSHVMDLVFDPGIALFAGLNAVPKRSYLSAYSVRVDPRNNLTLMSEWAAGVHAAGLGQGASFDLERMVNHGYLPRVYLSEKPHRLLNTYVAQYLKEEVAAEGLVRRLPAFSDFLGAASFSDCETLSFTAIARETGVSGQTIRGYFDILVDTLLGRFLPSYRHRPKRRTVQSPKFYFADVGVVNFLARRGRILPGSELFGKAFENWVFHELCAYNAYREAFAHFAYWRLSSGIEVDFVINHIDCAIEAKASARVNDNHLKGLRELERDHPETGRRVVVSLDEKDRMTGDGIEILHYTTFLERLWEGGIFAAPPRA